MTSAPRATSSVYCPRQYISVLPRVSIAGQTILLHLSLYDPFYIITSLNKFHPTISNMTGTRLDTIFTLHSYISKRNVFDLWIDTDRFYRLFFFLFVFLCFLFDTLWLRFECTLEKYTRTYEYLTFVLIGKYRALRPESWTNRWRCTFEFSSTRSQTVTSFI